MVLLAVFFVYFGIIVLATRLHVFGVLPGERYRNGLFEIQIAESDIDGEAFFLESLDKTFAPHSNGAVNGPLIPVDLEPFTSVEAWQRRSHSLLLSLDSLHLPVLGSYMSRMLQAAADADGDDYHFGNILDFRYELDYIVTLCLSEPGVYDYYLGWFIPWCSQNLLRDLEEDTKQQVLSALVVGEEAPSGGLVSKVEYTRLKEVLSPASSADSRSPYQQSSEESSGAEEESRLVAEALSKYVKKKDEPSLTVVASSPDAGRKESLDLTRLVSSSTRQRIVQIQQMRALELKRHISESHEQHEDDSREEESSEETSRRDASFETAEEFSQDAPIEDIQADAAVNIDQLPAEETTAEAMVDDSTSAEANLSLEDASLQEQPSGQDQVGQTADAVEPFVNVEEQLIVEHIPEQLAVMQPVIRPEQAELQFQSGVQEHAEVGPAQAQPEVRPSEAQPEVRSVQTRPEVRPAPTRLPQSTPPKQSSQPAGTLPVQQPASSARIEKQTKKKKRESPTLRPTAATRTAAPQERRDATTAARAPMTTDLLMMLML